MSLNDRGSVSRIPGAALQDRKLIPKDPGLKDSIWRLNRLAWTLPAQRCSNISKDVPKTDVITTPAVYSGDLARRRRGAFGLRRCTAKVCARVVSLPCEGTVAVWLRGARRPSEQLQHGDLGPWNLCGMKKGEWSQYLIGAWLSRGIFGTTAVISRGLLSRLWTMNAHVPVAFLSRRTE